MNAKQFFNAVQERQRIDEKQLQDWLSDIINTHSEGNKYTFPDFVPFDKKTPFLSALHGLGFRTYKAKSTTREEFYLHAKPITGTTCKGSIAVGSACMTCERCVEELYHFDT